MTHGKCFIYIFVHWCGNRECLIRKYGTFAMYWYVYLHIYTFFRCGWSVIAAITATCSWRQCDCLPDLPAIAEIFFEYVKMSVCFKFEIILTSAIYCGMKYFNGKLIY